jgi:hypothetical protein
MRRRIPNASQEVPSTSMQFLYNNIPLTLTQQIRPRHENPRRDGTSSHFDPFSQMLTAASRLCFLHNQVNERLHKPEFDCANLDATYDCGCGDAPVSTKSKVADPMDLERDFSKDDVTVGLIKGGR